MKKSSMMFVMAAALASVDIGLDVFSPPKKHWKDKQTKEEREEALKNAENRRQRRAKKRQEEIEKIKGKHGI